MAAKNAGSCCAEPWCGILRTSASQIRPCAQNRLLAGRFDVASEQQPQPRHFDHDHQAAVILLRGLILVGSHMVHRSEHLQFRLPNAGAGTRQRRIHRNRLVAQPGCLIIAVSGPGGASGLSHS